jgi:cell division protein FtsQ
MQILGLDPELVEISGNSMVSDNEIRALLDLRHGQNILRMDTGELGRRLMSLDRIKYARIKRNFPDSLYVVVQEVEPAGYLIRDGARYVVTTEGEIFQGLEGPTIEFKARDPEMLKKLAAIFI